MQKVICKVFLDQVTFIAAADYKVIHAVCQSIGLPPISIIGFGLRWVSSEIRVPRPPASITAFIALPLLIDFNR